VADARPTPAHARHARVIFLGPPGVGKGTQAALVAQHLGVPRISTGDMLREAIAQGTPLGKKAAPIMEKGGLVPDDMLLGIVSERLKEEDTKNGYVLDGFPRTIGQAKDLEEMVGGLVKQDFIVFEVVVPREEILRRLSGRRLCPKCQSTYHLETSPPKHNLACDKEGTPLIQREDDKEAAVERRLNEYMERTAPLIDYYRGRSCFHQINGHRSVQEVFGQLREILEAEP
jgi:adenylate kinase